MRKARGSKVREVSNKPSSVREEELKQVDLGAVREQITNLVGNGALEMVKVTMNEASQGHYLAMKYLFEMVGLCPATTPEETLEEDSLAKTLLRRLKLPEEISPGTKVSEDSGAAPVEQKSDAVK